MTFPQFFKASGSVQAKVMLALFLAIGEMSANAADRVVGANATLDIEPDARAAALGSATFTDDGLADQSYAWFRFSHTSYYEDTKYDYARAEFPLGEGQGLGVSFSRFGADDIPYIKDGEPLPEGSNYNTLSVADWVFAVAWAKRLTDRLSIDVSFYGLYREMDQTGWGFRGDAGVRFRAIDQLHFSGLLKGWTSSATTWESGQFEYSSPEFYLAADYTVPVKYLYGSFGVYWQGAGLFHQESRNMDFDTDEDAGARLWEDPVDWLSGGHGGVEFNFDFGLSLRAGLSSFTTVESFTAGAGLLVAHFLQVDYAFESHPVLSPVHRVSVSVCPYMFSHAPKQEQGHLTVETASKKILSEEPEENAGVSLEETSEDPVKGSAEELAPDDLGETSSDSPEAPSAQASPAEDDDEVLEPSATGGTYWEE